MIVVVVLVGIGVDVGSTTGVFVCRQLERRKMMIRKELFLNGMSFYIIIPNIKKADMRCI
jgi:hypothetical protein